MKCPKDNEPCVDSICKSSGCLLMSGEDPIEDENSEDDDDEWFFDPGQFSGCSD